MDQIVKIVRELLIVLGAIVSGGGLLWIILKRSRDPAMLLSRWALTAMVLGFTFWEAEDLLSKQSAASVLAPAVAAVGGLMMAILWTPAIVDAVGRKFSGFYDGGDEEVELRPYYSVFLALRGKGKYDEALAEVQKQLQRFPTDFEGQMHLAELLAEHMDDLPGAERTVEQIYTQPGHTPRNIAFALNRLADWYMDPGNNRAAAQQALQKIIELLPDTEMALQAAARIGRLADPEALLAGKERGPVAMPSGVERAGLPKPGTLQRPAAPEPGKEVADMVRHLEAHPLDSHIREQLAVAYADHYQRLDLAAGQLEQLIGQSNQAPKQVVHWLNLLADLQIRHGANPDAVRATLQRIIDQYPDVASAQNTRRRLDILSLEIKAHSAAPREVKLGSYEQNIGLKGAS
jgi:tetratricopeptide (TPR) repeat protein